jgi:hypothetical protein
MPIYGQRPGKPELGAMIDRSRPLSQGLLGLYAINEAAGSTLYDAAGNPASLSASGFGSTSPWGSGRVGTCLSCTVTGAGFKATVPAVRQLPWPLTIAVAWQFAGNATSVGQIFGLFRDDTTNFRLLTVETTSGSTGANFVANSTNPFFQTSALGTTADHVASFSVVPNGSNGTGTAYVDGLPVATGAVTGTATWSSTSPVVVGACQGGLTGRKPNALVHWAAWWGRELTAIEHATIGASPSAIFGRLFMPPAYRLFGATANFRTRRTLYGRAGSRGVA